MELFFTICLWIGFIYWALSFVIVCLGAYMETELERMVKVMNHVVVTNWPKTIKMNALFTAVLGAALLGLYFG